MMLKGLCKSLAVWKLEIDIFEPDVFDMFNPDVLDPIMDDVS